MQEGRDRIKNHDVGLVSRSMQKKLWWNMSLTILTSWANVVQQDWRENGTRAQSGTRKYFLCTRHSQLSTVFYFFLPTCSLFTVKKIC